LQTPICTKKLAAVFQRSPCFFSMANDLVRASARILHPAPAGSDAGRLIAMGVSLVRRIIHVSPPLGVPYNS